MITFRTDKNIEVSASVTYIALQSVSDKFNYDETFDALWDTDNPDASWWDIVNIVKRCS